MTTREVVVRYVAEIKQYQSALASAGASTKAFAASVKDAELSNAKGMSSINRAGAIGGAAMLALAGYAVKASAAFDAEMSKVRANSGATAKELNGLKDAAFKAGTTTAYSATQAAGAEDELAKAGFNASQIIAGLPAVLSLAAAGQIDLSSATEITASTLKQFGLQAADAGKVADVLAAGADKSLADVQGLAESLKYAAPSAHTLGVSLTDTTAALALFADNGLQGSIAGTNLNDVLTRLGGRSGKAGAEIKDLGLEFFDAQGHFLGLAHTAEELHTKLAGLSDQQRLKVIKDLFGAQGMNGALALYRAGAKGVNEYVDAVDKAGFAAKNAAIKNDNLTGDVKKLSAALQTDFIKSGEGANGALRGMAQGATDVVRWFGELPAPAQQAATWVAGLGGAALLSTSLIGGMAPKVREVRTLLEGMGRGGEVAIKTFGTLGKALPLVGVAAVAAFEVFRLAAENVDARTKPVKYDIDALVVSLKQLAATGQAGGELARAFGPDLSGLAKALDTASKSTAKLRAERDAQMALYNIPTGVLAGNGADEMSRVSNQIAENQQRAARQAGQSLDDLGKALAAVVTSGGVTAAKLAYDDLRASTLAAGGSVADLDSHLKAYKDAAGGAAAANTLAAQGFSTVAQKSQVMADGLDGAVKAGQTLLDVFNSLNGVNFNVADATIAANQAATGLAGTLAANNKTKDKRGRTVELPATVDFGSARGQANFLAIEKAIRASMDLVEAKRKEALAIGSTQEAADKVAQKVYTDQVAGLRKTLTAAHFTTKQIDDLIAKYFQLPPAVATPVTAPGATKAKDQVQDLQTQADALDKKITTLHIIGTQGALDEAAALQKKLQAIEDKLYYLNFKVTVSGVAGLKGVKVAGGTQLANADGNIYPSVRSYANGGFEDHTAQIAPAGAWRVFAEPETGGEAYIPLGMNKRPRSKALAEDIVHRFGGSVAWQSGAMFAPAVHVRTGPSGPIELGPRTVAALAAAFEASARSIPACEPVVQVGTQVVGRAMKDYNARNARRS